MLGQLSPESRGRLDRLEDLGSIKMRNLDHKQSFHLDQSDFSFLEVTHCK